MVQIEDNSCPIGFEPYTELDIEMKVPHSFLFCPDTPVQRRFLHDCLFVSETSSIVDSYCRRPAKELFQVVNVVMF
jgi:hypothetical protein